MRVEALNIAGGSAQQKPRAADKVESARKELEDVQKVDKQKVQPEELLSQIKGLTEQGLYSVRFENDENSNELVVKIVDRETDEVIRQVPAEEIVELRETLKELVGNIFNAVG